MSQFRDIEQHVRVVSKYVASPTRRFDPHFYGAECTFQAELGNFPKNTVQKKMFRSKPAFFVKPKFSDLFG